jgi:hypothetical protein
MDSQQDFKDLKVSFQVEEQQSIKILNDQIEEFKLQVDQAKATIKKLEDEKVSKLKKGFIKFTPGGAPRALNIVANQTQNSTESRGEESKSMAPPLKIKIKSG